LEVNISEVTRKIRENEETQKSTTNTIEITNKSIERNMEFLTESKRQYTAIKTEEFDDSSLNCPTCGQLLPIEKQEPIKANFEAAKQKRLQGVIDQGNLLNESIQKDTAKITELEQILEQLKGNKGKLEVELSEWKSKLEKLPSEVTRDMLINSETDYSDLDILLHSKNKELDGINTTDTDTLKAELLTQKKSIQEQIEVVQGVLGSKKYIDDARDRVEELKEDLKIATQNAAYCERLLLMIENFEKAKMKLLSEKINQSFKLVQWKLFHTQKNGGIENVCVAMVHGSPYGENTTSTTERLMAGLDIINTLQEIYQVKAPIFVDNAESYNDFNIPQMDCQMILLNVSEDSEIRVEG
jgi:hypothetical protein